MIRLFDILFSFLAIAILSPLFILVMLILKMTGEGEVFFIQNRIGKDGKTFGLIKFVTMVKDSPNIGTGTVTVKGDPRILPVGSVLRKTKINELPQLFNILLADMSVIGPRPLTNDSFSAYPRTTQDIIKKVCPGLSGIGSIIFRKEEEILSGQNRGIDFYRNILAPYKGKLEEWFVEHNNIKIYFSAISVTLWVVISPKSPLPWFIFKNLPTPPNQLKKLLNFPS